MDDSIDVSQSEFCKPAAVYMLISLVCETVTLNQCCTGQWFPVPSHTQVAHFYAALLIVVQNSENAPVTILTKL